MPAEQELPDYLDEVHQDIAEFYERHADFLDEDFIDGVLSARGYQQESRWALPAEGGGGQQQQRKRPGARAPQQQQQRQRSGSYFGGKRS